MFALKNTCIESLTRSHLKLRFGLGLRSVVRIWLVFNVIHHRQATLTVNAKALGEGKGKESLQVLLQEQVDGESVLIQSACCQANVGTVYDGHHLPLLKHMVMR